jgi:phosphate starvation-inducible protein PhoH
MNAKKPSRIRLEHLIKREPMTHAQSEVFDGWKDKQNIVMTGSAGTGKTFIALYLALESVLSKDNNYERVVIVRSAVPTRDMGFLPGTQEEKEEAYKSIYKSLIGDLFDDKDAYQKLNAFKHLEFLTTSFLRGLTINNSIIIVDEAQNCNYHELCSIITRMGNNSKIIFSGDYHQSDFTKQTEQNGIINFVHILEHMKDFDVIEFSWKDIVRSGMVRDFLMTKEMVENAKL